MIDILLALLAAFLIGVSLFLQKSGVKKTFFKLFSSPKWLLGTSLSAVSFFIYLYALRIGGRLIIIQPLVNVSVIFLVLLEIVILKNKIKKYEVLSLILFFIGIILLQVNI